VFRHVVLLQFTPEATEGQVESLLAELAALPEAIAEIRAYQFGKDAGVVNGNADLAVVADFDDVDGYRVYATHPEHLRVIKEYIRPIMSSRMAAQYLLR
jgi:hypothetical protein